MLSSLLKRLAFKLIRFSIIRYDTLEEIAKKFGVSVDKLKIKKASGTPQNF